MKKLTGPLLFLILISAGFPQNWFKGSVDQALAQAKTQNKPLLLDFFAVGG
jgi:hypothetical protein